MNFSKSVNLMIFTCFDFHTLNPLKEEKQEDFLGKPPEAVVLTLNKRNLFFRGAIIIS
jgi:hypothetical protein